MAFPKSGHYGARNVCVYTVAVSTSHYGDLRAFTPLVPHVYCSIMATYPLFEPANALCSAQLIVLTGNITNPNSTVAVIIDR